MNFLNKQTAIAVLIAIGISGAVRFMVGKNLGN